MSAAIQVLITDFATTLTKSFGAMGENPGQREDQLKSPVKRLIEGFAETLNLDAVANSEATSQGGVRPDFGVSVHGLLTGHVELKAPGKGVKPGKAWDKHDKDQFAKLRDLPNLIYTDGNEFALYRSGEVVGKIIASEGDLTIDGGAAISAEMPGQLEALLRDFLSWTPIVPKSPRALADLLAPLTRYLRDTVSIEMDRDGAALAKLAEEWRGYFFADADDEQFADAYAQTVTYALLLARVEGATDLRSNAVSALEEHHGLLARVLRWLSDDDARAEVEVPVDLLERAIEQVDPDELARRARRKDLWLYFYEDFLAAYDPKSRRHRGAYYTPAPVVQAQVRLVDDILQTRFAEPLGIGGEGVSLLDPAVGTGTYLLEAVRLGTERVKARFGEGEVAAKASRMAERFYGFELMIGPYAVSHMRIAQQLRELEAIQPADGLNVFLTDTLESPSVPPPKQAAAPLFYKKVAEENERARRVKNEEPILVCVGNPPYYRQTIEPGDEDVERQGGWIRYGDEIDGGGILQSYLDGIDGVHVKNLYNLYVYFWRWATWKVFENPPAKGIVAFITASSYLRGPGFAGMRRHMRQEFDELFILDLGGDGIGARRSENVFDIQTPVAIGIGIRTGEPQVSLPATTHYARIDGTRDEKYAALLEIEGLSGIDWQTCLEGWEDPLLPLSDGGARYREWPKLTDLFPWQHSGMQYKRTWPISAEKSTLEHRWESLVATSDDDRAAAFKESRDRKIAKKYPTLDGSQTATPIRELNQDSPVPRIAEIAYRSFDRQHAFADNRLGDYLRPPIWHAHGPRQLYLTSLLTKPLGNGPAAVATHLVPDLDVFCGRGAKDVVPLWRDKAARQPNIASGVLEKLEDCLSMAVGPEEFFAYAYAILQAPSFTARFVEELEMPGPHLPVTADPRLFSEVLDVGRKLLWLHTFGERFVPSGKKAGEVEQGDARSIVGIGSSAEDFPEDFSYEESTSEIRVGKGRFGPVTPEMWAYEVSGLRIVRSWLGYRMKKGSGRKSSPLDEMRPATWPESFSNELLELLWTLENTLKLGSELDRLLDAVIDGETISGSELPTPSEGERKSPKAGVVEQK